MPSSRDGLPGETTRLVSVLLSNQYDQRSAFTERLGGKVKPIWLAVL
jgi:hypothetical protein